MIEYSKTAADNKARIRELTWARGRFFIYFAAVVFVLMVYFAIVGLVTHGYEAIRYAISTGTLFAVLIAVYLTIYNKYKKAVTSNFDNNALDGRIDFTLEELSEGILEFTRLTDEESFEIRRTDIKSIRHMRSIHVIFLKDGRTIDLPRREDIDALLESY